MIYNTDHTEHGKQIHEPLVHVTLVIDMIHIKMRMK